MSDTLAQDKASLRQSMRVVLGALDEAEIDQASSRICGHIIASDAFARAANVLMYYAMDHEVNLGAVGAMATMAGKTLCFPRLDWDAGTMEARAVHGIVHDTEVRRHGIPEPTEGRTLDPGEIGLVLVPGLAFDGAGGRLGRGGGFYDRYLARARQAGSQSVACGVALGRQVLGEGPEVPVGPQDERLDLLATEKGLEVVGSTG